MKRPLKTIPPAFFPLFTYLERQKRTHFIKVSKLRVGLHRRTDRRAFLPGSSQLLSASTCLLCKEFSRLMSTLISQSSLLLVDVDASDSHTWQIQRGGGGRKGKKGCRVGKMFLRSLGQILQNKRCCCCCCCVWSFAAWTRGRVDARTRGRNPPAVWKRVELISAQK